MSEKERRENESAQRAALEIENILYELYEDHMPSGAFHMLNRIEKHLEEVANYINKKSFHNRNAA